MLIAVAWIYRNLLRPVLFLRDAETSHEQTLNLLAILSRRRTTIAAVSRVLGTANLHLPTTVFGIDFPNPVGLAAGLDKNAVALPIWPSFGFGFVEIGTVTAEPQSGNPRPRIFRLRRDEALLNCLGFPNEGAEKIAARLADFRVRNLWPKIPVGINIGKSATVALENATADYVRCFELLRDFGDFFVINVSSPNTPHLRELQERARLEELLAALQAANQKPTQAGTVRQGSPQAPVPPKPLLLKISPDLTFDQLDEIIEVCQTHRVAGIVATNTTVDLSTLRQDFGELSRAAQGKLLRQAQGRLLNPSAGLRRAQSSRSGQAPSPSSGQAVQQGGISGKPLRARSTEFVRHISQRTLGALPIIGVGGITSGADAYEKIRAGASLVELYTGFVYEGPFVIRRVVDELRLHLARDGFVHIEKAVGDKPLESMGVRR